MLLSTGFVASTYVVLIALGTWTLEQLVTLSGQFHVAEGTSFILFYS